MFSIPDPGSASKNLSILIQTRFLNSRKYDPGQKGTGIPDPDPQATLVITTEIFMDKEGYGIYT
jgi:hypothetical protein